MNTDRNLLFGVLALQSDMIEPAQFVETCAAWAARKDVPLAEILVEHGWITARDKEDVERLLDRKLQRHGGDVRLVGGVDGSAIAFTASPVAGPSPCCSPFRCPWW